ncbi:MAG: DegT/DnrJ/EryC1/StrS family aminotransferase [Syntrophales bacterium]
MILCSNPLAQYHAFKEGIDEAIARVLNGGRYILGEEVRAFEKEFAQYIGVSHGVGVGSGTEALHLALVACGIGDGDEVITVSHTAVATVAAIELTGARPVLVDIDPERFTLDPTRLLKALSVRTRAVIPVHLYGQPADMDALLDLRRQFGFRIIEDCSQAHGAMHGDRRVGSFGDMGCFSFYPTKNLGALGDGGMVVTSDGELAGRAASLREYGWVERYVSSRRGWNTRLDELQAAILRVKLPHLDRNNARRFAIARAYTDGLAGTPLRCPGIASGTSHVFHLYVVRATDRNRLLDHLQNEGIGALIHYPVPVHLQPAYAGRLCPGGDGLEETEMAAGEVLSLPLYPELEQAQIDRVINVVRDFYGE